MVFVLRNNQAALTDMRYDLQDGEESQRDGPEGQKLNVHAYVCVYE